MKTMYGGRMLARARKKYGVPVYPGRKNESNKVNKDNKVKSKMESENKIKVEMMKYAEGTWGLIKDVIKNDISAVSFETWIQPCRAIEIKDYMLVLVVENDFVREMLGKRYLAMLRNAVRYISKQDITEIKLITEEEYKDMEEGAWKR